MERRNRKRGQHIFLKKCYILLRLVGFNLLVGKKTGGRGRILCRKHRKFFTRIKTRDFYCNLLRGIYYTIYYRTLIFVITFECNLMLLAVKNYEYFVYFAYTARIFKFDFRILFYTTSPISTLYLCNLTEKYLLL